MRVHPSTRFHLSLILFSPALLVAPGRLPAQTHVQNAFVPGEIWSDSKGKPINAHGGGMLYYRKTYYWYGENKVGQSSGSDEQSGRKED